MMLIKHLPQKRSLSPLSTRPLSNNQPSNAFTSCFPDTRIDAVSDIIFTHSNYLEVVRIPPKLDRLAMLLAKCPYGGPEEEQRRQSRSDVVSDDTGSIPVTVYAMADFLHEVQASEAEIRLYLDETGAIEIDDTLFRLSHNKICRLYGEQILIGASLDGMALMQFLKMWQEAVPQDLEISLNQIRGLYLLDGDQVKTIRYFPKSLLSTDSRVRFEDLFKIRKRWLREDMLPFVEDLASTDKARELIILRMPVHLKLVHSYFTPRFTAFSR
ncbi:hypothetical protein BSLG_006458 [Batrachochytrium salamandrivorans]|nr:hypothetical protein BSLG_006458 [Batrachochytrium salamandrivorans]